MKAQSESEIRKRLAGRVRAARKRKSWTQQALADASNLPRTYIADIEGARRNPSLRSLLRVSTALEIPLHEFFQDSAAK